MLAVIGSEEFSEFGGKEASEEVESILGLPFLWHVGHVDVLLDGFTQIFEILVHLVALFGLLELLSELVDTCSLVSLAEVVEGLGVVLSPVRLLELLELLFDIVGFSFDDLDGFVVDVDAVVGLSDVLVESLEEIIHFFIELLALWTGGEVLIELVKGLSLLGLGKLIERVSEVLNWLGILDLVPGLLDIGELFFDFLDAIVFNLDLESVCQVHAFWNIGDLDVFLQRCIKFLELSLKSVPLSRLTEFIDTLSKFFSLWSCSSLLESGIKLCLPLGVLDRFQLLTNIFTLLLNLLKSIVVNMDASLGLMDVGLQSFSKFLPFFQKLLTLRGSQESSIKLLEFLNLWGVSPLLEVFLDSSDRFGVLDGLGSSGDIGELFLDFLLALWGDINLKHLSLRVLPFLWYISDFDILLNGILQSFD